MSTVEHATLDTLREVMERLDELDERLAPLRKQRAALIAERDVMIRELRHTTSAPRIGKITGLSTTGIYKIARRDELI